MRGEGVLSAWCLVPDAGRVGRENAPQNAERSEGRLRSNGVAARKRPLLNASCLNAKGAKPPLPLPHTLFFALRFPPPVPHAPYVPHVASTSARISQPPDLPEAV